MAGVDYHLRMPDPHTHLLEVEVRIRGVSEPVELVMPSWTPGSYLLREFARHVQDFEALGPDDEPLPWRKTDKCTWRVETGPAPEIRARYRVYANEPSVRTSHLDASHASVNGASAFLFVKGREGEPHEVAVDAPEGWAVATAMEPAGPGRWRAATYDELVDSPLEIGTHRTLEWEQDGIPHRYVFWGSADFDGEKLVSDTRRIIDVAKRLFGSLPYPRYLFIVHLLPEGRGGLEHAASTLLQAGRGFGRGEEYESFLALVAHEFFHVWNAKRIRPAPLGPFDYTRENYTRNLWVVEGLTTYYTDLILRRAGLITPERYLQRLAESIARHEALPGRHHQSLAEASFDSWIRFYRPDEHTPNSQVSYYQKGALVGLLLDMEIRRATSHRRSLDDLMRLLWTRYGQPDVGYPEEMRLGIQALAEEVAGVPLETFFARYVWGLDELPFDDALAVVGLRRLRSELEGEEQGPANREQGAGAAASAAGLLGTIPAPVMVTDVAAMESRIGIRTRDQGGRARVVTVLEGTTAYAAGVNAGDEIVAVDGVRVGHGELPGRLKGRPEGEVLRVTLFRREELMELEVRVGPAASPKPRIARIATPPEGAEAGLVGWLGAGERG